jgi:hypothetical protein
MKTVAAISVLMSAAAHADASNFAVFGVGNSPCGQWTADRTKDNPISATMELGWVQGFLSGVSFSLAAQGKTMPLLDKEGVEVRMSKHCKEHPADTIATAAQDLALQLAPQ